MTSNLGSERDIGKNPSTLIQMDKGGCLWPLSTRLIRSHFRPEFLNRLDDILPFLPLREEDMEKIALIQLHLVAGRLVEKNVHLEWEKFRS